VSPAPNATAAGAAPRKPWWRGWVDAVKAYRHPRVAAMLFPASAGRFHARFSTLSAWLRGRSNAPRSACSGRHHLPVKFPGAVDRLQLPLLHRLLGRRRSWMLLGQVGIAIGLMNMAHMSPVGHLAIVASLALLVAFSSATQDISVDAWRIEAAPVEMQGVMAAAYQLGYRIAMMVASAGALWIAADYGWLVSYTTMAGFACIGIVTTLLIPEPTALQSRRLRRKRA
jgi:PAT family beta-lactamase induction signal transducer AmpG